MKRSSFSIIVLIALLIWTVSSFGQLDRDPNTVVQLSFDETDGDVAKDSSGNGHDGTIKGAKRVPGKSGQAVSFNGGEDAVEVAIDQGLDFGEQTDFTVECWINTTTTARWSQVITQKLMGDASEPGYQIILDAEKPVAILADGQTQLVLDGAPPITDGQWHHLALVCDRDGEARFYVDGKVVTKKMMNAIKSVSNPNRPLLIGSRGHDESLIGLIDEVRISSVVREIKPQEK